MTEHFSILEPEDQVIDEFYVVLKSRSTDFVWLERIGQALVCTALDPC